MSVYTGQIGQILHVYTQRVKAKPNSEAAKSTLETSDTVSFSMTAQQKSKLERLALEDMSRITRKSGNGERGVSSFFNPYSPVSYDE